DLSSSSTGNTCDGAEWIARDAGFGSPRPDPGLGGTGCSLLPRAGLADPKRKQRHPAHRPGTLSLVGLWSLRGHGLLRALGLSRRRECRPGHDFRTLVVGRLPARPRRSPVLGPRAGAPVD